ncbi:Flavin-dependent L-tryptophan oxidase RebO precursor [Aquisphaera giovannonii]|uniref:Flavin-dependent L-tryptophan oxidase RebO n=1 Tax=Aquisphaera giovannonii TaxID=406548 RepID=A0A5B9VVT4_9BACT|nr:FAD-dependent oxidoreductase [Aquisphaera giovannonii]QEH31830.1 Flavin-dependent L-tryptophan oxidase RebO precursor [Aquisphaera giovannonii]
MQRAGRSPLFRAVRRAFQAARLRSHEGTLGVGDRPGIGRRRFLASGVLAAAYAARPGVARAGRHAPRIAVVGAGIAGLNATYLLANAGLDAALYEGSDHIGGRIQTNHGGVAPGVYTELGGEFIDSGHDDMLALAQAFGLGLIDTQAPGEAGLQVAYYAKGRLRSEAEVIDAFGPLAATVDGDSSNLSDDITFQSHSKFDVRLDRTPLDHYLRKNAGVDWLYDILEAAYVNEFGLDLKDQSTLNFVETIGTDTSAGFAIYGESDQRFKILGGNHQVVAALAERVADRTELAHRLEAIARRADGTFSLTFQAPGGRRNATADYVVLCLPFTTLRSVDIRVPLPPIKQKAIHELGYGVDAKLILGFQGRPWRDLGYGGDSYADLPYQSGWDSSREQATTAGAYTIYPGGDAALALQPGTAHHQAERLLPGLDRVFPGARSRWLGTALRAYWPGNPFIRASYAAYRPGQWTTIRGAEGLPVGRLSFAGEHTSLDWQGYMNGGAESGRLAAEALIARLA